MTLPLEPPSTIGSQPINAAEVNNKIGQMLRDFLRIKETINQNQDWLLSADLKVTPYGFTDEQETLMKSAVGGLDSHLDDTDMTFITRLVGLI